MKKILFISWSPKKWNTDRMISHLFRNLEGEKDILLLKEKNIKHCLWCGFCEKGNGCAIKDDMQDIIKKLVRADIIFLWSPNHFANVSWITKMFIDRLLPCYHARSLKGKKVILLMPGSSADSTNKKYMLQGAYGFVDYQYMKLLWAYGFCTEDEAVLEKKMERITQQVIRLMKKSDT